MTKELLRKEIASAFVDTIRPPNLFRYSGLASGDIPKELRDHLLNRDWSAVRITDWLSVGTTLNVILLFLAPEGAAYYVPSLLMGCLDDELFMDFAIEAFVPPNDKRLPRGEWWGKFTDSFEEQQKSVIRIFLDYVLSVSPEGSTAHYLSRDAIALWIS